MARIVALGLVLSLAGGALGLQDVIEGTKGASRYATRLGNKAKHSEFMCGATHDRSNGRIARKNVQLNAQLCIIRVNVGARVPWTALL